MMDWNEDFAVGVDKIDNQHKKLFNRINILLASINEDCEREKTIKSLIFFREYIIKDFDDEEEMQKKTLYPKYSIQHVQHEEFKNELSRLQRIFETEGTSANLIQQVQENLSSWFREHIINLDNDFGRHLKSI